MFFLLMKLLYKKQAPKGLLVYRNPSLSFWGEKNLNKKKLE